MQLLMSMDSQVSYEEEEANRTTYYRGACSYVCLQPCVSAFGNDPGIPYWQISIQRLHIVWNFTLLTT